MNICLFSRFLARFGTSLILFTMVGTLAVVATWIKTRVLLATAAIG